MKVLLAAAGTPRSLGRKPLFFSFVEYFIQRVSLTLTQLAAITPPEHQITIVDENNGQEVDVQNDYDIVAISSFTKHIFRAYEIADTFRKKGTPVVLGGYHPSVLPKEAKQHADAVVIGEAEYTWPQLLKDYENGKMKPFYQAETPVDPQSIPPAIRNLGKKVIKTGNVQATRGCPYQCEFCSIHKVEGHRLRKRPIENVVEEIKSLKTSYFSFNDTSLTIDPEYTKSLFQELKGLHKRFRCFGNINTLNEDEDLIKLSKEAGCQCWHIGFESISQESLDGVQKANKVQVYESGIKKIKSQGIGVKGLFIFGFDEDTKEIFSKTLKAIRQWKIESADFSILTPYPGTPLFDRLERKERIFTKDWSQYNLGNVVFIPKLMTPHELLEGTRTIANIFHSWTAIFKRTLNDNHLGFRRLFNKFNGNLWDKMIMIKEQGF